MNTKIWIGLTVLLIFTALALIGQEMGLYSFGGERDVWGLDFNEDFTAFQIEDEIEGSMEDVDISSDGFARFNYRFYNIRDALLTEEQCSNVVGESHVAGHCWTFGTKTWSGQCAGEVCGVGNNLGTVYNCVDYANCMNSGWVYKEGCPQNYQPVTAHKTIDACSYSLEDVVNTFIEDDKSWADAYCDDERIGKANIKVVGDLMGTNLGFTFEGNCDLNQTLKIKFNYIAHHPYVSSASGDFTLRPEGVSTSGSHTVAEELESEETPIAEDWLTQTTVQDLLKDGKTIEDAIEERYGAVEYNPDFRTEEMSDDSGAAQQNIFQKIKSWFENTFDVVWV